MNSRQLARSWPYPRYNDFRKKVENAATAWFDEKEFARSSNYSYLLDKWENWRNNIILPEVVDYILKIKSECEKLDLPFPLHNNIHHGLSSQAMLFNLVGPLIISNDLEPLRMVVSQKGIDWPVDKASAQLEYEDRSVFNEDSGQPTSIDLVISDSSGFPKLFIESKFVERDFGGCSLYSGGDCNGKNPLSNLSQCYLHFIGRMYWQKLEKHHFTDIFSKESLCILAFYYQFFRELVFALEKGGTFILLLDERSPVFYCKVGNIERGLLPMLQQYVPEAYYHRYAFISVQQLVNAIKQTGRHSWITEFEKKYGLI